MSGLNIRNVTLMALIVSCFMQVGAQLFALSVVASTIAEAPPRSFAILEGEYRYDSAAFWGTVPAITGLLFIVALIANWRTRRRTLLLASFALFLIGGLVAGLLLEPEFAAMTGAGYSDTVDPALQRRAASWLTYDWAVWGTGLAAGIALLLALALPVSSSRPRAPQAALTV
jgi:hypothetical protein